MAKLDHAAVVRVLDVGPDERDEPCWFAMELFPRGDVRTLRLAGELDADAAFAAVLVAAEGLAAAHAAGLLHRDVKPHNVLVGADGRGRLTDFDLVLDHESTGGTRTGAGMGTFLYAAPELLGGASEADARADVYGLGMTLLFALQGRDPRPVEVYGKRQSWTHAPVVPERLRDVLARAAAVEPEERFATVAALVRALQDPVRPRSSIHIPTVTVPAGSFWMGSPDDVGEPREGPRHRVTLTRPFLMGVTTVTQAQWASMAKEAGLAPDPSHFEGGDRPVELVSWQDVVKWCNALSAAQGRPLAYTGEDVDLGVQGWRLPTEAEWEYACRAGTDTPWSCAEAELGAHAWFDGDTTRPVGQKKPNPWGLHDMHGNVWEWCVDGWQRQYTNLPAEDPLLPPASVGRRVIRGGAFDDAADRCRSAFRNWFHPVVRDWYLGFRIVCPLPPPQEPAKGGK